MMDQLGKQHVGVAGPPFARYRPTDDGFDVEAGFPATGPVSAAGRVVPSALPGGAVATTVHRGDYAGLGQTYSEIENWLAELEETFLTYYGTGPETASPVREPVGVA